MKTTRFVSETACEFKISFNEMQLLLNSRKISKMIQIEKALNFIDLYQFEIKSRETVVTTIFHLIVISGKISKSERKVTASSLCTVMV